MKLVGLTGSIGMGKSAIVTMLRQAGVPVFDADAEVHTLQGPTGRLVPMIEERFPGSTGPFGVNRAILGAAVLGKPMELRALEKIVHPAVAHSRQRFLKQHQSRPFIVLDIPLLFEKGGFRNVDEVVVVSAPAWKQRKRVLARPGMTVAKFRHILSLQLPDAEKRRRADHLIDTGGTFNHSREQVRQLIACLNRKKGQ